MATIKYYTHKPTGETKIYIRIKEGKTDIRQSTRISIQNAKKWDVKRQEPKDIIDLEAKATLVDLKGIIKQEIISIQQDNERSTNEINSKWLKTIILGFHNDEPVKKLDTLVAYGKYFTKSLLTKKYKKNGIEYNYKKKTIDKYKNIVRHFEEYDEYRNQTSLLSDIDLDWAKDFLEYLTDVKELAINTKGKFITRLKTILKDAQGNKKYDLNINPDYRLIESFEDEVMVTYLDFEEIDKIIDKKMPDERMQISKDWFIISCFTAQRISDLFRMNKKMIVWENGRRFISLRQFKTGQKVLIPIHFRVEEILNRYDGCFPPLLSENEQSNRSLLSQNIKKVVAISGIRQKVRGRYNGIKGVYPKWKLISNHTGRRSFACNFYNEEEWSNADIMNITGHKTESSFYKYIDRSDTTLSHKGSELFEKMRLKNLKNKRNKNLKVV